MSKRLKNPVVSWNFDNAAADTMTIPCFKKRFLALVPTGIVADLFARNCKLGSLNFRNDIDPETSSECHLDVFDFLNTLPPESVDAIIIDPPFSFNQAAKHYKNSAGKCLGVGWLTAVRRLAGEKIKKGGYMFCLGWDGNGAANREKFNLIEVVVCAHGQTRNATIMTIDQKK